jgi:hypothetical protein
MVVAVAFVAVRVDMVCAGVGAEVDNAEKMFLLTPGGANDMDPGPAKLPRVGDGVPPDPEFQADVGAANTWKLEEVVKMKVETEGAIFMVEKKL